MPHLPRGPRTTAYDYLRDQSRRWTEPCNNCGRAPSWIQWAMHAPSRWSCHRLKCIAQLELEGMLRGDKRWDEEAHIVRTMRNDMIFVLCTEWHKRTKGRI